MRFYIRVPSSLRFRIENRLFAFLLFLHSKYFTGWRPMDFMELMSKSRKSHSTAKKTSYMKKSQKLYYLNDLYLFLTLYLSLLLLKSTHTKKSWMESMNFMEETKRKPFNSKKTSCMETV